MKARFNSLAPAILLNGRLTLRALLRVRLKPVGSLGIICALLLPEFDDTADDGPV
jgi:hypothetical protein